MKSCGSKISGLTTVQCCLSISPLTSSAKFGFRVEFNNREILYFKSVELILVSWACNKVPQTGWIKITKIYSVTVLEARNPKSRCQQALFPLKLCNTGYNPSVPLSFWWGPALLGGLGLQPHLSCFCLCCLCVLLVLYHCACSPLLYRTPVILV